MSTWRCRPCITQFQTPLKKVTPRGMLNKRISQFCACKITYLWTQGFNMKLLKGEIFSLSASPTHRSLCPVSHTVPRLQSGHFLQEGIHLVHRLMGHGTTLIKRQVANSLPTQHTACASHLVGKDCYSTLLFLPTKYPHTSNTI